MKYNAKNERVKRDYLSYQSEAKQKSPSTLKGIRKAIHRYEVYTNYKDFATFNKAQAIAFKKHLSKQKALQSGEMLSKSTILQTVNALKEFFQWIVWQPGYKSKIHVPDIDYLNLSEKEISIAKAPKLKDFPTIEQVTKVVNEMPTLTVIDRRNRALIAFTILTGIRDAALATLRLRHIDLTKDPVMVKQEPDLVKTKFSKSIISNFLPVGGEFESIVRFWIDELKTKHLFAETDPLFPRTKVSQNDYDQFEVDGIEPVCWSTASPIRKVFKDAFLNAGLPYYSPHRFRDTLVHLGQQICQTPEQFKAWSQSLGHESPLTTFSSYGTIDSYRQGEIISKIKTTSKNDLLNEVQELRYIVEKLAKKDSTY